MRVVQDTLNWRFFFFSFGIKNEFRKLTTFIMCHIVWCVNINALSCSLGYSWNRFCYLSVIVCFMSFNLGHHIRFIRNLACILIFWVVLMPQDRLIRSYCFGLSICWSVCMFVYCQLNPLCYNFWIRREIHITLTYSTNGPCRSQLMSLLH